MEELMLCGQGQLGVQQQIVAGHVRAHVRRRSGCQAGHGARRRVMVVVVE